MQQHVLGIAESTEADAQFRPVKESLERQLQASWGHLSRYTRVTLRKGAMARQQLAMFKGQSLAVRWYLMRQNHPRTRQLTG